jgi:GntR family transcriptional regulator
MDREIRFLIHPGSSEPIYRQLMDQLRRRVAAGQWLPGQELPSVRELAAELAVHPMTISKAYSLLEGEGLLLRRRGLAMVIAGQPGARAAAAAAPAPDREALLLPALQTAARQARELGVNEARAAQLFKQCFKEDGDA